MHKRHRLDVSEAGDVTIVRFRDRRISDDRKIAEIGDELFDLVERQKRKRLVVSLASVDYLSSAALGKLITLDKKATVRGGLLKLCSVCPDLAMVLSITRLDRLFEIEKDEAAALAAFQGMTPADELAASAA